MKKLLTILCLVLLFSLSTEVSFSQSNQEECDLLCQMGLSESTETQIETQTEIPKKEVPSYKLVERRGIIYEANSQTPFTGSSVGYRENGDLQSRGNYKDGKLDGLWEDFNENGQLMIRENYKNGELNGLYELFYENGQLEDRGNFKDGEPDGLWEYFDKNGELQWKGTYKDGVLQE